MNALNLLLGLVCLAIGAVVAILRLVRPGSLGKLEAMRERLGHRVGGWLHALAYIVVPIGAGVAFLVGGD